jgi:hypothetical protein
MRKPSPSFLVNTNMMRPPWQMSRLSPKGGLFVDRLSFLHYCLLYE